MNLNTNHGLGRAALRFVVALVLTFTWIARAYGADTEYKLVRVETAGQALRVRLPLTDVSGKVRPKERTPDGYGEPLAPTKTVLGEKHFLEWQIGYDTREADAPNVVKAIQFVRKGETKFGAELSKLLVDALRLGVISTNDILRERDRLAKLNPTASARLANRLIEASDRSYWQPDADMMERMRQASDELEDRLEGVFESSAS